LSLKRLKHISASGEVSVWLLGAGTTGVETAPGCSYTFGDLTGWDSCTKPKARTSMLHDLFKIC